MLEFLAPHDHYTVGLAYPGSMERYYANNTILGVLEAYRRTPIATGRDTTFYIDEDGNLYGCGDNGNNTLGIDGSVSVLAHIPLPTLLVSVSTSAFHTCLLTTTGQLYVRGDNEHGQLGLGDTQPRSQFTPLFNTPLLA